MENKEYEDDVDENYNPEEEVQGDWKIKGLDLPEVATVTGEENEEELTTFRTKLYRWRDSQWKERGVGHLRFLQHKENKKVRVLMRQDKTKKVVCNFLLKGEKPLYVLAPQVTTDKAWVFNCYDFSDEEAQIEKLCARLTTSDEFQRFKVEFEKYLAHNHGLEGEKKEDEKKDDEKKQEE